MSDTPDVAPYSQIVTGRAMPRLDPVISLDSLIYYRIHFLPDGYPAQRTSSGVQEHPIIPTYVLRAYLTKLRT